MKIVPNNTYVQTQDSSETALAEQIRGIRSRIIHFNAIDIL